MSTECIIDDIHHYVLDVVLYVQYTMYNELCPEKGHLAIYNKWMSLGTGGQICMISLTCAM